MTKNDIVKKVAEENGMTQAAAGAAVDSALNAVMDAVAKGEKVSIFGFGTFSLKHRKARMGRIPATGELKEIPASSAPAFKPMKAFKDAVNK